MICSKSARSFYKWPYIFASGGGKEMGMNVIKHLLYAKHCARPLYIYCIIDPDASFILAFIHCLIWFQSSLHWKGGNLTSYWAMWFVMANSITQHGNFKASPWEALCVSTCPCVPLLLPRQHAQPSLLVQEAWESHGAQLPQLRAANHNCERKTKWLLF